MDDINNILQLSMAKDSLRTLARLVRTARQRRNWTLSELSVRAGVPSSTISRLERTGLASTAALFDILFALDELSAVQDCLSGRLRQNELPRSLADVPNEPHRVLRVRHGKGEKR